MKKISHVLLLFILTVYALPSYANIDLQGAWSSTLHTRSHNKVNVFAMIQDDFVVITYYSAKDGSFIRTFGGEVHPTEHDMSLLLEFDSEGAKQTGKVMHFHYTAGKNKIHFDNSHEVWSRIGTSKKSAFSGKWNMETLEKEQTGMRVIKLLSQSHFQWIAYNKDENKFIETKGGEYRMEGNEYTEEFHFYSKKEEQIGTSQTFNFEMNDGIWKKRITTDLNDDHEEWSK